MATPTDALSTLSQIQQKVRRITRSPSQAQLTDADLNNYINTFTLFDFPAASKLFSLRTVFTFYTQPGVDVYGNNTTNPLDPFYDFNNKYTAIHDPIFIAGVQAFFTQDRDIFYGNWPQTNFVQQTALNGNGTTGPFAGVLPPSLTNPNPFQQQQFIVQNSVLFTALDVNGTAMLVVDTPTSNVLGNLTIPNGTTVLGTINYVTGAYSFSFPNATAMSSATNLNPIWGECIYFVAGLPTTVLYYNNEFTLRPIPDKAYIVQVEANMIPTEFFQATNNPPNINQWWQYIALGASIKIFQDRMDMDSVDMLMPEFLYQKALVDSTSLEQYTNQRSITIYSSNGTNNWWNNFGSAWPF